MPTFKHRVLASMPALVLASTASEVACRNAEIYDVGSSMLQIRVLASTPAGVARENGVPASTPAEVVVRTIVKYDVDFQK